MDEGEPRRAFDTAISNSNKVAMSLSTYLYRRHKEHFRIGEKQIRHHFTNEQEIMSLKH